MTISSRKRNESRTTSALLLAVYYATFFCFFSQALYSVSEISPFSCTCFMNFRAFLVSRNEYMACTTNVILATVWRVTRFFLNRFACTPFLASRNFQVGQLGASHSGSVERLVSHWDLRQTVSCAARSRRHD